MVLMCAGYRIDMTEMTEVDKWTSFLEKISSPYLKHTFPLNLAFVLLSLFGIELSFVYLRMKSNHVHLSASIALAPSVKNKCCSSTFSMASVVCPAISTRPDVCMPW